MLLTDSSAEEQQRKPTYDNTSVAAAVSPLIAGYVIQKTNNWNWPFPGSMGLLLGAILAFRMKPDELFARGELEPMPG